MMKLAASLPLTIILLGTCILTTTVSQHRSLLRWLRLILAAPTCLAAFSVAYPPFPDGTPAGARCMLTLLGSIFLLRVLDVCVVGFWDEGEGGWPRWQVRKEKGHGDGAAEYVKLPLPTTLKGRLAYTLDSICSWRGSSVFEGCSWDWAQRRIREYNPSSRSAYLRSMTKWVVFWYLLGDATEHFLYTRRFDLRTHHPVTSLPFLQQIIAALALPIYSYAGNELSNAGPLNLISVGILRLPPSSCPPVYTGHPFQSASIADFWSFRWQTWFRRSFLRLSLPAMWILDRIGVARGRPFSPLTASFVRNFVIFGISAAIHVGVTYGMEPSPERALRVFEPGQISFFLAQPFGLLVEAAVVNPVTEGLPGRWKPMARRAFGWIFMVWTGRWMADWYALLGLFQERPMPFSPIIVVLNGLERLKAVTAVN